MSRNIKVKGEFVVYLITNTINEKKYVGITSDFKTRKYNQLNGHNKGCKYLYNAINKHGKENFKIEIIDKANSWKELCEKEIYWIDKLDSFNSGMNMTKGGEGSYGVPCTEEKRNKIIKAKANISDETRKKQSKAATGRKHTQETKDKLREINIGKSPWNKGLKTPQETKNKQSKAKMGKKLTQRHKDKIGKGNKGKIVSIETGKKISKIKMGHKVTEETRDKLRKINQKLTDDQVVKIRKMLKNGISQSKIAKIFNVSQTAISSIKLGRTYKIDEKLHRS